MRFFLCLTGLIPCFLADIALADWRADVGLTSLRTRLGAAAPTGAGIRVTQVEACESACTAGTAVYAPNPALPQFEGKTIELACPVCSNEVFSNHASNVAAYFFGSGGTAIGVTSITANEASNWLFSILRYTTPQPPWPVDDTRVHNHSWIGSMGDEVNRRYDYVISRDGIVACVGVNNNITDVPPNLAAAYNVISVGLTSGRSSRGPITTGDGIGRVKPEIVASAGATSWATPIVSGAATLLLQVQEALDVPDVPDDLTGTEQRSAQVLLTKALLLAGATKAEFESLGGWRKGFETPSIDGTVPLDYRFGAGELNIDNSHRILTTNPQQTACDNALRTLTGWNYAKIPGGGTHRYFFEIPAGQQAPAFSAIVTWNRHIDWWSNGSVYSLTPSLANIDLRLRRAQNFVPGEVIDQSISAVDNVEHIYQQNLPAGRYVLEVTSDLAWTYALAWDAPTALAADYDGDGDVDAEDFEAFRTCATRAGVVASPACRARDLDGDGDVDLDDFGRFQRCYSGANVPANPACLQ